MAECRAADGKLVREETSRIIFGIWNSHTSVGNILGAVIAAVWVNHQWGYSFIVPGLIIMACGVLAYFSWWSARRTSVCRIRTTRTRA